MLAIKKYTVSIALANKQWLARAHTHIHSITVCMEHEHFENPFLERHSCHCFKQFHILSIYRLAGFFFFCVSLTLSVFSYLSLSPSVSLSSTLSAAVNLFSYPSRSMRAPDPSSRINAFAAAFQPLSIGVEALFFPQYSPLFLQSPAMLSIASSVDFGRISWLAQD